MKVTREKTEDSQAYLSIEMEPSEVEDALEMSYHRLVKRAKIPGFRKGKAPRAILERYLGKESLFEDAMNTLVPEACEKAIEEQEIEAIARPQIEIAQADPVVFKAVVPLRPTIELGDYRQIRMTPEPFEVASDNVDAVIERLRHQHATWEPVERPVDLGDLVVLDIESTLGDQPFVNQQGAQFQVVQDAIFPAPGFSQEMLGMEVGEEREFRLTFPADYPRAELAEKEASFKVRVAEIKQEKLPELDDEFAQAVNPEFKTPDKLREQVSTNLRLGAEERAKVDFEERVVEAAVDLARVEFPPIMVEADVDRLLDQQLRRWQAGDRGLDEYLKNINRTEEELREELRPLAMKRVTQSLVLGRIAEEEKIEVADSEVDAEIGNVTKGAENKEELGRLLNAPQSREAVRRSLVTSKTVQRLAEIAKSSDGEENQVSTEGDNLPRADA